MVLKKTQVQKCSRVAKNIKKWLLPPQLFWICVPPGEFWGAKLQGLSGHLWRPRLWPHRHPGPAIVGPRCQWNPHSPWCHGVDGEAASFRTGGVLSAFFKIFQDIRLYHVLTSALQPYVSQGFWNPSDIHELIWLELSRSFKWDHVSLAVEKTSRWQENDNWPNWPAW